MAPTPEETLLHEEVPKMPRPASGEEVVISGMSGIFPKSDSVEKFMKNLYDKVDMVSTENPRWVFNHPEVPKHLGMVDGMGKFDAQFFRVHYKQAWTMEPMSRKLLEHAYSAIYDSGINPLQLRGKKVGVFIGSTFSESEKIVIYENVQRNGFGITGCNKAMYANRISYWIDGKGPSYALDVACSSSMACVEHAYRSISSGQCDAAIVGGCNLCMHPNVSLHCRRAGFLCLDGKTKCFDKNGDGHVRSDAISVMFMQRAKDAKRIYSEVYHAKISFSPTTERLLPIRVPKELEHFLEAFYSDIGISPTEVEYVEAHGAAFVEADSNELQAVGRVFGKKKPIKIGCVKSNMGSSEPASGMCALTKVCLAYHNGKLPGNLHYNEPLDIPEVKENKVQVLTDTADFNRGFAALNSFSYGGVNVHVLLKGHYKKKDTARYASSIPRLVLLSGRKDTCLSPVMEVLKNKPVDPEEIGLLNGIHQYDIPGHMSRGYTILGTNADNKTECLAQSVQYYDGKIRPLWFVYSGMGSQWTTMGAELMKIPIFAAAIQKCHKVLEPKGIDIVRILCDPDKRTYDNILNSFVGIAAVQIGLTDILTELGIVPDNIIGHSVGELGCAYADGCFTAEEMILSAYSRGLVSVQTPFIRGSMAAVGLGYKAILPLCPPEIEVACHNSSESATISGPADIMKEFVSELVKQGIFAKEVPCSNIAYHSRYIADAGPGLLKYLSEVIKSPKPRSKKWVSTSVPEKKWNEPIAKYSSAEYHTNNLLNSVLFEEMSKLIPSDALVIEIAPHGLLQAILKRSLAECIHVPLTRRGTSDSVKFLLEAVGKLYQAGLNPKIDVIYPKIEYPVSTGTPFLSQYVEWEHSEDWSQAKYKDKGRKLATIREFVMSIHDDDFTYFRGHVRDGNYVFPEAAILQLTWETLAMYKGFSYKDMSVIFRDVIFHKEAIIKVEHPLKLQIMIHKGNNRFEVTHEDSAIVSGFVSSMKPSDIISREIEETPDTDTVTLSAKDVYTIMSLKGYSYKDEFQSIHSSNSSRTKANIKWSDKWIPFLDSFFQFNAFARDHPGISTPSLIKKLSIDVKKHDESKQRINEELNCVTANVFRLYEYSRCGGIEVDGLVFNDTPVLEQKHDVLLNQEFVPHRLTGKIELKTALQINLQLVAENVSDNHVKIIDSLSNEFNNITELLKASASNIPFVEFTVKEMDILLFIKSFGESHLLVTEELLGSEEKMNQVYEAISNDTFILTFERDTANIQSKCQFFNIITSMSVQKHILILLRKVNNSDSNVTYLPITQGRDFSWIPRLQAELKKPRKVVLVSDRQPYCGLLGMVKKLRQEFGNKIGLIVIDDYHVPTFNTNNSIYSEQLKKSLTFNVLKKGQWGGYYYLTGETITNNKGIVQLTATNPGDIESLSWIEEPMKSTSDLQVQVCYAGPSFRDAQNVSSRTSHGNALFGMDFSGVTKSGEKVMGLVSGGAIASVVVADPDLIWPVPEHWTLEDAATVPLVYTLVYYSLSLRRGFYSENKNVFITGGASAFGQACIAVCQSLGFTVYTSVSNLKKKDFLMNLFPDLDERNIGVTSSGILFNDMVRLNTKGQNCIIVMNCLSGEMRKAAMSCTSAQGCFLDLSDTDKKSNGDFEMSFLSCEKCYVSVNINTIFKPEYVKYKKYLQSLLSDGIAKGVVRPLARVIFTPTNVTRAFRLLSFRKRAGKVLLSMKNPQPSNDALKIISKLKYSSKGSYIVVCDENILGMELADRLVKQGARKLVIHIKPNAVSGYCYTKLLYWKLEVTVKISSENLQTQKGCMNLLEEALKLGPILGIFTVQNSSVSESWESEDVAAKFNNTALVVANLDLTSRNVCNELEHFVVLGNVSKNVTDEYMATATDRICNARKEISLPSLFIRVGLPKEFDDNPERSRSSLSAIFNALETSLKLKHNSVISFNKTKNAASEFMQRISKILGVKNINDIDENIRLKDLLVYNIVIEELNSVIKEAYQISNTIEKTREMTISDLKHLGSTSTRCSKISSGLGAFFTYIKKDECMAAEPVVTMATSFSNVQEEDELDPKATYLMLLPGFESHYEVFTTVCERLKVQAVALQYEPELANADIPEIAASIMKLMKKRFEMKSKFYLLGYSFGVNVALELAALFEKEGHVGVVYCLDSSPDALRAQLDAYLGHISEAQLQNNLVEHMYRLMDGQNSQELVETLEKIDTWDEKVELCVKMSRGIVNFSHQYKRTILQGAFRRIMLAREYEPDFKLRSELILIKGIPHPNLEMLTDDYGLSKYTTKQVQIFNIEADHPSAPSDCRVANIVNRLLEPKLLEEFKNKNLCWTYIADPIKSW